MLFNTVLNFNDIKTKRPNQRQRPRSRPSCRQTPVVIYFLIAPTRGRSAWVSEKCGDNRMPGRSRPPRVAQPRGPSFWASSAAADVEAARQERDHRDGAPATDRAGPDLHAVDRLQPREQILGQLARPLLDFLGAADLRLEGQRLAERHHRGSSRWPNPSELFRHSRNAPWDRR